MDTVRKNYPELPPTRAPHFHSVRAGNLLFLSGATARDTEAAFSDIRAQADVIYKRIKFILEAEGGSVDNVVKVTQFVTEIDEAASKAVYETRQKYFGEKVPASTRVQVVGLVDPNLKIEIEAIAVLPD
jgi:enamine deaminase RidA (YjgF/YER057c/UK114 family)